LLIYLIKPLEALRLALLILVIKFLFQQLSLSSLIKIRICGTLLRDVGSLSMTLALMEAVLKKNGHRKGGSKLNLGNIIAVDKFP